ncbi:MAG: tRNA (guanosine(46)-N7)-methyltransferase TrmB [Chloroflexi bacterium]|nr:MAG: tRNA (guanosine(46)-N7)-methyltransferase TrmB [Chloroflexota bacterium]
MHILYDKKCSWPTDWTAVYHRSAPLVVEIGFGGGHFLIDLARKRPLSNILGIEISLPSLRRGAQKAKVAGLDNVRVINSNAWYVLWTMCEPQTVDAAFINFPDPWPKANHHRRRIISDRFLQLLATRMKPGGTLDVATDHAEYAEWVTDHLARTPYFDSLQPSIFVTEDNERLRTKYELTAIAEGRTCHYYKFQRNNHPADNIFPVPKELPMPHVVLQVPIEIETIRDSFERTQASFNNIHLSLTELFQARDEPKLFIEAYVKEEPLAQRVGIVVRQMQSGEYMISLHELGFPRVTTGIHFAIGCITKWILGLNPEITIKKSNLPTEIVEAVGIKI